MKNSLPRGLRLDHGYIQVRLKIRGVTYCKNFGPDSPLARELGSIHLAEKRREILMGKAGMAPPLPSKSFADVCKLVFATWSTLRDGDGKLKHNEHSQYDFLRTVDRELKPYFGSRPFESITSNDIQAWRDQGVQRKKARNPKETVLGTTFNRYQNTLSTIFSCAIRWVESGKIKPAFKTPLKNPCESVDRATLRVRQRDVTDYELKKLKMAFVHYDDADGWEVCKLALKSVLSKKDLENLDLGQTIDIERSKSGVPVNIPVPVLVTLNWTNWRSRWQKAVTFAGLQDIQFRDFRKKGINRLKGRHDPKLISEYAGHASLKTTERHYFLNNNEQMKPLAVDLDAWVEQI